eukprot:PRCOL_00006946-RA
MASFAAPAAVKAAFGSAVDATFGAVDTTVSTASSAAKDVSEAADVVVKATKPAVDAAAPVVSKAASAAAERGAPVAKDAIAAARAALTDAGAPVDDVTAAATKAAGVAAEAVTQVTPIAKSGVDAAATYVTTNSPETLLATAAYAVGAYVLLPPLLSAASALTRGYAGELAATDLLERLLARSCVLVDIRSDAVRVSSGEPDLPQSARGCFVHWPVQRISRKERGQIIARRLAREGYGKAYVLGGGFGEWKRASLRTREVTKVFVETVAAPKLAGTISGGRTVRGFLE